MRVDALIFGFLLTLGCGILFEALGPKVVLVIGIIVGVLLLIAGLVLPDPEPSTEGYR